MKKTTKLSELWDTTPRKEHEYEMMFMCKHVIAAFGDLPVAECHDLGKRFVEAVKAGKITKYKNHPEYPRRVEAHGRALGLFALKAPKAEVATPKPVESSLPVQEATHAAPRSSLASLEDCVELLRDTMRREKIVEMAITSTEAKFKRIVVTEETL